MVHEGDGNCVFHDNYTKEWSETLNNQYLINLLQGHIVEVTFTKVDGTERVMKCTLRENVIPTPENGGMQQSGFKAKRQANPNVAAVWDVEASGWRSFRLDSVKDVVVLLEEEVAV